RRNARVHEVEAPHGVREVRGRETAELHDDVFGNPGRGRENAEAKCGGHRANLLARRGRRLRGVDYRLGGVGDDVWPFSNCQPTERWTTIIVRRPPKVALPRVESLNVVR